MKLKIDIIDRRNVHDRIHQLKEWEDFVYNNPLGNIFQSIHYMKIFYGQMTDWSLVIIKDNNIIGGMLSTSWPRLGFLTEAITTIKTTYGPLLSNCLTLTQLNTILNLLFKTIHRRKFREHIILSKTSLETVASKYNYSIMQHSITGTFILDLYKDDKLLWRNLEKRCRWSIRKAMKIGFKVQKDGKNAFRIFHILHLRTCRRLGIAPNPISFYARIQRLLCPMYATYLFAYLDDKPVAALILLKYKDTAYYYSSAMLEKYRRTQVMSLLLWKAIIQAKEEGYKYFDFLFHPNPRNKRNKEYGLYLFKRGFGGYEKRVHHYVNINSKIGEILWNRIIIPSYRYLTLIYTFS